MSNMRIVYPSDDGGVCVVVPSKEWLDMGHTMDELAKKDVPAGKPFEIVDVSEVPSDRTFRGAWSWAS